jgi:biopolymer transport protein ExbD
MNFRGQQHQDIDIVVTPLIDVVLVLLIFYMVSTTFVTESQLELTLPEASVDAPADVPETIEVTIDRDGNVFVDDKSLVNAQPETLRRALIEARGDGGDPVLVIGADAVASHQSVIDVMDAARRVGLHRVTFPTRVRKEE